MPSPARWTQLLVFGLAISGCHRGASVPSGDIVATLTAAPADERAFDPTSLRGKPTIVLFASPTCPHCTKELPIAQAAAHAEDANIVAVFVSGAKKHAASVTKSVGFTAPVLVDDGTLLKRYDIRAVPYTLVLGPDGHARDAFRGEQDESTLRAALSDAR
jgi:thiol-disulfide isomerase/thioredoxin